MNKSSGKDLMDMLEEMQKEGKIGKINQIGPGESLTIGVGDSVVPDRHTLRMPSPTDIPLEEEPEVSAVDTTLNLEKDAMHFLGVLFMAQTRKGLGALPSTVDEAKVLLDDFVALLYVERLDVSGVLKACTTASQLHANTQPPDYAEQIWSWLVANNKISELESLPPQAYIHAPESVIVQPIAWQPRSVMILAQAMIAYSNTDPTYFTLADVVKALGYVVLPFAPSYVRMQNIMRLKDFMDKPDWATKISSEQFLVKLERLFVEGKSFDEMDQEAAELAEREQDLANGLKPTDSRVLLAWIKYLMYPENPYAGTTYDRDLLIDHVEVYLQPEADKDTKQRDVPKTLVPATTWHNNEIKDIVLAAVGMSLDNFTLENGDRHVIERKSSYKVVEEQLVTKFAKVCAPLILGFPDKYVPEMRT